MSAVSLTHSILDRSALPVADIFYRANVPHYRRYGRKARGFCPFHQSSNRGRFRSTPFSVDIERGLFHCFSCGVGGDVVEFVKLRDGVDFITAARTLGALRPLGQVEAQVYWRDRDAKKAIRQRKDDAFCESLELLLKEMLIYEAVRDWAFRQCQGELQSLAEQLITAVGADYVRLKVEHYEAA